MSASGRRPEFRAATGRAARRRAAAAIASILLVSSFGVAGASGLIVRSHGRRLSYEALPGRPFSAQAKPDAAKPVEYHGGPVMPSNTNYTVFWDPPGASEYAAGYQSGIDRYLQDLAHDSGGVLNTDSVLAQYGDKAGEFAEYDSRFGGEELDTDPYPASGCTGATVCLTDEQIRAELVKFVQAAKLPIDLEHEYFLLTPPGVGSCMEAKSDSCSPGLPHETFCSYHGFVTVGGAPLIYANIPYLPGTGCDPGEEFPNGSPSDAALGGGLVHEHSESVTDPELNAWYDVKGEEVADKCRTFKASSEFGTPLGQAPDGANYNQVIDDDLYWYQQEWSNAAEACVQRASEPPAVTKLAPKSGPASGGTLVTITGARFATGATVSFGAAPATEVVVKSATSLTAVSPAGAAGTVAVTVTTAAGTSTATKKSQFKYKKAKT